MIRIPTKDEPVTLIRGDCLDVLRELPDGCVDAVVTDPPYGIGERMQGGTWGAAEKYADFRRWDTLPPQSFFDWIGSVSVPVICWGGNYFPLPPSRCWLIWDKTNAVRTMADAELAWTNLDRPTKRYSGKVGTHETGHPTEKPLSLMRWCMQFVPKFATVIDPFMGSGTTGVACVQTGRRFIGIEIDENYFKIAERRINEALGVGTLFPPATPATAELFT